MKKILLPLFILLMAFPSFASDDLSFGVTAGLNVSSFNDGDLKAKTGFNIGAKCEYVIEHPWFVEGAALLSNRGFKFDYSYNNGEYAYDNTANLWYLHVPVSFGYKFDLNQSLTIAPKLGLFAGLGLWGSDDDDDDPFTDYDSEFKHNIERGDFGFSFGANLWIVNHLEVSTGYEMGAVDNWSNKYGLNSHSRNWYLNLAFLF